MFQELLAKIKAHKFESRTRLDEVLSPSEVARIKAKVGSPDIRPGNFDITLEAWLKRISLWGKINILHTDPDLGKKRNITQSQFITLATDDQLLKMLGQWDIERKDINKVEIFREYVGVDRKKKKESFFITIDLNPEIKKALK